MLFFAFNQTATSNFSCV